VNIWQIKKIARPSKQDQKHISLIYKETKEGQPYLTITKSRFMGEGKDRKRASIIVFPDHAQDLLQASQEMVEKL
jgi:hypothetical protein